VTIIHPNLKLLSDSSDKLLHSCPRKYELYKLLLQPEFDSEEATEQREDTHLSFGTLVGYGVQRYLTHLDLNRAQVEMLAKWPRELDADLESKSKKSFWHALIALDNFPFFFQEEYPDCQLYRMDLSKLDPQNEPATELGYIVDCGEGFYDRGFIDAVLINTKHNILITIDCKTTSGRNPHEAAYQNLSQVLGYSLVLDTITSSLDNFNSSFNADYIVWSSTGMEWKKFSFPKSRLQRSLWIKNKLLTMKHIAEYSEENYFPMYGESCFSYFKLCQYFGVCELKNEYWFPRGVESIPVKVDDLSRYQFHFKLEDIIEAQLAMEG